MTQNRMQLRPYPLGAHYEAGRIRFAFSSKKQTCGIILYDRVTGRKRDKIYFLPEERIGNIYCKYIDGIAPEDISYHFFEEDRIIPDERARAFERKTSYGKVCESKDLKAVLGNTDFDWENDKNPKIPYDECIAYCMHVRGFTKHSSSKAEHRGTFLGICEKIDYLKEIGITTIELQPAYEFIEMTDRLNYWGYQKGYYYAPKAAYAAGKDVQTEFMQLVKELHKNNLEVVMQFFFPKEISRTEIPEILRFWVLNYHVDGFHLMGENLPMDFIAQDAMLSETKLWYYQFNTDEYYDKDEKPAFCNLAEYKDDYLYTMRKFLKGDENMLEDVLYHMRHIPEKAGRIHYMSNYYGLTIKDMVSYDHKHNEANGEKNFDGNNYNCSWNCGEEGNTRKKKVMALRTKQIKNAFCLLMMTQSTPLIFMGDEFGNSQQGNNNPYCQDNTFTWLDWRDLERNKEIYLFFKQMVTLRKEHPILHPVKELRIMDYISCGYPDLSYHGQSAWRPRLEYYFRHIGIMFCGKYAKKVQKEDDNFFYLAINMHWEIHELALPKLPKGMEWKLVCMTGTDTTDADKSAEEQYVRMIAPRSIAIYTSINVPETMPKKTTVKKIKKRK